MKVITRRKNPNFGVFHMADDIEKFLKETGRHYTLEDIFRALKFYFVIQSYHKSGYKLGRGGHHIWIKNRKDVMVLRIEEWDDVKVRCEYADFVDDCEKYFNYDFNLGGKQTICPTCLEGFKENAAEDEMTRNWEDSHCRER